MTLCITLFILQGKFPAYYPVSEMKGQTGIQPDEPNHQPLEPNHSHFILIDDSSRDTFGGEIKWRAEFEKFLSQHVLESGITCMEEEPPLVTQTATQPESQSVSQSGIKCMEEEPPTLTQTATQPERQYNHSIIL